MVDYVFKVVIIGDEGVGKSSLLHLYNYGEYKERISPTIGVDFFATVVEWNRLKVKLQIWDTSGNSSFLGITHSYFKHSIGAIIVFKDDESFNNVENWILHYKNFNKDYHSILVVNNSNKQYDCINLIRKFGVQYLDSSDMKVAFKTLVEMILEDYRSQPLKFKNMESFKKFKNVGNRYVRFEDDYQEEIGCCSKCVIL